MNNEPTITFEANGLGKYRARTSLTVREEMVIEQTLDDFLGGNLHLERAKIADWEKDEKDVVHCNAASKARSQLNFLKGMFTLDILIEEMPEGVSKPSDMESNEDFLVLYAAYLEKKNLQGNGIVA